MTMAELWSSVGDHVTVETLPIVPDDKEGAETEWDDDGHAVRGARLRSEYTPNGACSPRSVHSGGTPTKACTENSDGASELSNVDDEEDVRHHQQQSHGDFDAIATRHSLEEQMYWDLGVAVALKELKTLQLREQRDYHEGQHGPDCSHTHAFRRHRGGGAARMNFDGLADTAELARPRSFIVNPHSRWRIRWNSFVTCVIVYSSFLLPLFSCRLCSETSFWIVMNCLAELMFMCDVLMHFITAYDDELRDIVVTQPSHVAKRYMRGWFVCDIIGAVPLDRIVAATALAEGDEGMGSTARMLRMLKLVRALRLLIPRKGGTHHIIYNRRSPSFDSLLKIGLALMLLWHWTACLYYDMSLGTEQMILDRNITMAESMTAGYTRSYATVRLNSTHATVVEYNTIYYPSESPWRMPITLLQTPFLTRYLYCLSWAIGITCQLDYPAPNTLPEMLFSNVIVIIGFVSVATMIGSATNAIADLQAHRTDTVTRLQRVAGYLTYKKIGDPLRSRILSYYSFLYSSMNMLDENTVLDGLPRALRLQMDLLVYEPIFVQLPIFWMCSTEELLYLVQRLKPCMAMPGEALCREGKMGVGLFLLMKGAVETASTTMASVTLMAVAAFGEKALRRKPSGATVRAMRFCELAVMLCEDFAVVEALNPQLHRYINNYIIDREKTLLDPQMHRQSQVLRGAVVAQHRTSEAWRRACWGTTLDGACAKRHNHRASRDGGAEGALGRSHGEASDEEEKPDAWKELLSATSGGTHSKLARKLCNADEQMAMRAIARVEEQADGAGARTGVAGVEAGAPHATNTRSNITC